MDYMLKKNYPLKFNNQRSNKSHSNKHSNIPKSKNRFVPSMINLGGENTIPHSGGDLKKYKSTNKTISVNSLPKIDSYLISNTLVPPTTNKNKGQFELFVRNKTSYFKNSDLQEENEIFSEIELLWDELGITDEYQDQFELYIGTIVNPDTKNRFLSIEKSNLNKAKEILIKFSKEKKNRLKNIELLKQLNNTIKLNNNNGELKVGKEIIKSVVDCIKAIRINSINVINNIIKIRESLTCYSIEDKIDFDVLFKNFGFDNNYLLKMNSELSFLKYSEINKIFEKNETDENLDTFIAIYNNVISNGENEKIPTSISKEMYNAIDKCRYYIAQDGFLNNIKVRKKLKSNKVNGRKINNKFKGNQMALSNCFRDNNYNSNCNTNYMDAKLHKLKSEMGKDYNNIFMSSKQNSNINIPNNNNRRFKVQSKRGANSNVIIYRDTETDNSPYRINTNIDFNLDLASIKKERQEENYDHKYDDFHEEKLEDILKMDEDNGNNELFKKYNINLKDNENSDIRKEEINGGNQKEKEKNKEKEIKVEKENNNENNDTKEEKEKKEKEKKNVDDDDDIIDMNYLDDIKE